jgi:hypothetical protein
MALTHEDIQMLKQEFDDRYVLQSSCSEIQEANNSKFANDDKRLDRIELLQENGNKKIDKNNWLTITILGVIISTVIGMILKNIGVF